MKKLVSQIAIVAAGIVGAALLFMGYIQDRDGTTILGLCSLL